MDKRAKKRLEKLQRMDRSRRNPMAELLEDPLFHQRVVPKKFRQPRKKKHLDDYEDDYDV